MTSTGGGYGDDEQWRYEAREPGARRKKLAGYLKAANELRQTYQQSYMQSWNNEHSGEDRDLTPGSYPSTKSGTAVRSGEQEMILFPSYARNHVKQEPNTRPGPSREAAGAERNARNTGDTEYSREDWEQAEDSNAIVDVDVRGRIFVPQSGPLNRKHRLMVGLARQMAGISAPTTSPPTSTTSSRSTSPHPIRKRVEAHNSKHEEEIVAKEAEILTRKGEADAAAANKGAYSEGPAGNTNVTRDPRRDGSPSSLDDSRLKPVEARQSWNAPAQMSQAELNEANSRLMTRVTPFLADFLEYSPISAFFYNGEVSRQKTIETDAYGHFNLRAALDFIPTHVRVLASSGLSATEEVHVLDANGFSVISDVDDTIKHSAIPSGAREAFRNIFIRDLSDLTVQGVENWYGRLAGMGVTFHYVSNSPWELFPLLKSFCSMAGLPKGSFHLRQYSGVYQGIFEPVAERKKTTLERLARDFPERRFLLIGDSGEADLEVYTDFVLENPGRVLGVFIRDITTPQKRRFFDSSIGSTPNNRSSGPQRPLKPSDGQGRGIRRSGTASDDDDAALRAGIAASLKDFEKIDLINGQSQNGSGDERPALPPRRQTEPAPIEEDLIDLASDDEIAPPIRENNTTEKASETSKPTPARPPKPRMLSSTSIGDSQQQSISRKAAPPRPKKPSTSVQPSGTSHNTSALPSVAERSVDPALSEAKVKPLRPQPPNQNLGYTAAARQKISSAYSHLPSPSDYLSTTKSPLSQQSQPPPTDPQPQGHTNTPPQPPTSTTNSTQPSKANSTTSTTSDDPRPPLPTRKPISSYPAAAAQYASSLYTAATTDTGSNSPLAKNPSTSSFSSTRTVAQRNINRANGNTPSPPASQGVVHANSFPMSFASGPSTQNAAAAPTQANKKEELWNRRWARADAILSPKGVVLMSWRVGGDIADDVVKIVQKAQREDGLTTDTSQSSNEDLI